MDIENHRKFIGKCYEEYKKIGYVECPAFNNEKIYFLKRGFRHLIWKGTRLRDVEDQVDRLSLLKYVPNILKSSRRFDENKIFNHIGNTRVNFWSTLYINNNIKITVVIR